ncbi:MAG TPA: hypothetical protein VI391_01280 [Thermoanaerobaculia bacterium]
MEDIRPYVIDPEETLRLPREESPAADREAAADDELPFEIPRD